MARTATETATLRNEIFDIFDKVRTAIQKQQNFGNYPVFQGRNYAPHKLLPSNFHTIREIDEFDEGEKRKKIIFVDGGNSEIIKSSNFSLQLVRIFYCIYKNNKNVESKRFEFYTYAYVSSNEKGRQDGAKDSINYMVELIPVNSESQKILPGTDDLVINSMNPTIKEGIFRADISKVGEIMRKIAEINTMNFAVQHTERGIAVRDGTLQCSYSGEKHHFDELYKSAIRSNTIVCALAKTNSIVTDSGNSMSGALNKLAREVSFKKWRYYPVAESRNEEHQANIYFVRLNESSRYSFRFETYKNQNAPESLFSLIAGNSSDPTFLGYPQGLITADRFAKISLKESFYLKTLFQHKLGRNFVGEDVHSILNALNY